MKNTLEDANGKPFPHSCQDKCSDVSMKCSGDDIFLRTLNFIYIIHSSWICIRDGPLHFVWRPCQVSLWKRMSLFFFQGNKNYIKWLFQVLARLEVLILPFKIPLIIKTNLNFSIWAIYKVLCKYCMCPLSCLGDTFSIVFNMNISKGKERIGMHWE